MTQIPEHVNYMQISRIVGVNDIFSWYFQIYNTLSTAFTTTAFTICIYSWMKSIIQPKYHYQLPFHLQHLNWTLYIWPCTIYYYFLANPWYFRRAKFNKCKNFFCANKYCFISRIFMKIFLNRTFVYKTLTVDSWLWSTFRQLSK